MTQIAAPLVRVLGPRCGAFLADVIALYGAVVAHLECHPDAYDNPTGRLIRQTVASVSKWFRAGAFRDMDDPGPGRFPDTDLSPPKGGAQIPP